MSAELLSPIPRRGSLRIRHLNPEDLHFVGWFHTDNDFIMRRGDGDTHAWKLWTLAEVAKFEIFEFTPDPVQP